MQAAITARLRAGAVDEVRAALAAVGAARAPEVPPDRRAEVLARLAPAPTVATRRITLGRDRTKAIGEREVVVSSPDDLAAVLNEHVGDEAWICCGTFVDRHRKDATVTGLSVLFADLDYYDAKGKRAAPPDDVSVRMESAAHEVGTTVYHNTPRGGRAIVLLDRVCKDVEWRSAAKALCERFEAQLAGTGIRVDDVSRTPSHFFWAPKATVDGVVRTGVATVIGDVRTIESLLVGTDASGGSTGQAELAAATAAPVVAVAVDEAAVRRVTQVLVDAVGGSPRLRQLVDGEWRAAGYRSSSDGYHALARDLARAGLAAGDDGDVLVAAVVDYLVGDATAWGRGEAMSANPSRPKKYTDAKNVERYFVRPALAFVRGDRTAAVAGFEALPPLPLVDHPPRRPARRADVAEQWAREGPLVHLPTGIAALDAATGGGLVLGSRVYLAGAPDAGKTALAVQLADHYLDAGVCVGILAVDEEPSDVVTRLLQRRGHARTAIEARGKEVVEAARALQQHAPLVLYHAGTTIEKAAEDLAAVAQERAPGVDRPQTVLFLDSVQTAHCEGEADDATPYRAVSSRVAAIREVASRHRMLVVATSEVHRGAYRSKKAQEQVSDMAAAKESGAIEFSARVLVVLRSAAGAPNVVEARIAKNKQGPSTREGEPGIFLRLDRNTQRFEEDGTFQPVDLSEQRATEATQQAARDQAVVADLLAQEPRGVRKLIEAASILGVPKDRALAARAALVQCGALTESPVRGGGKRLCVVLDKLPEPVRTLMAGRAS
ncbi:MAG: AAA family ATPase [Planctomycetes bacterium]|nr:AAA family ATPase [Planctomycetota bacterium]